LGVALFIRSSTGLQLTEAGQLLLPWARRLLNDSSNLQAMMSSLQDVAGELRIACSTTAGKYILPNCSTRFRLRFPGIQVRIPACVPEKVALDALGGEAHLGVLSREVGDANLEMQEFFHDTIKLSRPANHRWASRQSLEPSELLEEQ